MISREELSVYLKELFPKIVEIRNKIHSNPEISFAEFKTSALVCSILDELKIPYKKGIAGTGVLAWIAGKNPESKIIALRADMDALPIEEKTNLAQKSKVTGIMHACGHDVHTAILLGTASVLKKYNNKFEGTVLLVFQPGEEVLPGGAKMMLEEGLFA
ncbi:MAG: amidohydrolase, partial [Flavobacteriaceae bacterium]|nr:amidohydrolase [Flavobacteriaceae bacterium]